MPPWVRLNEALRALESGMAALKRYFRRYGLMLESEQLLRRVQIQIDRYQVR